jgi:hypothetical protein
VWFDETDHVATLHPSSGDWQSQRLRSPPEINDDEINNFRRIKVQCICPLHSDYSVIVSKFPSESSVPSINRKYFFSAVLQEAICKSPNIATKISTGQTLHGEIKFAQCVLKFETST